MEQGNPNPLKILIIAKYDPTFDWVHLSLQEQNYNVVGRVDTVAEAAKRVQRTNIDMVLADTSAVGTSDTKWIQQLAMQSPGILILVIAVQNEMDFVRNAMFAGAQGFLLKPFDLEELSRSIDQVYQLWLQRHAMLVDSKNGKKRVKANTIAVFSPKGGTGVTTVATNLAIALRQESDAPVLLVDADLYTADIDVFLNLFNEHSILDLIRMDQTVDLELLEQVTTEHVSGVRVLQSDAKLQFIDAPIDAGQMAELIEQLIDIWDGYIVINTGNNLNRWTAEILDVVNTVLLVTTPELPALRAMRNFLDLAEAHNDPGNKWQLAMNIYQSQKELRMTDIEASIHYQVHYTISQDREVVSASINRGSPLLLTHSKSPVAKDIVTLAQELLKVFPRPEKPEPVSDAEASSDKDSKRWFSLRQLFVTTVWPT